MSKFTISPVTTNPQDIHDSTLLLEIYAQSLQIDLAFQEIDEERATWPGKYVAPTGALLLARNDLNEAIGCVALRPLSDQGVSEMKRLYVDPRGRGLGVGKALVEGIVAEARRLGYRIMRLDTLPSMDVAKGLYRRLGFREIEAYYDTPIPETVFLELELGEN